jgi:hypothetical protein
MKYSKVDTWVCSCSDKTRVDRFVLGTNDPWVLPFIMCSLSIPVTVRSKAWVCGRSPAEIVGSNLTGGVDVCLLWVLCVVRWRSLRRADQSSRGVLPTLARRCLWSGNLVTEEAMARVGPQRQIKTKICADYKIFYFYNMKYKMCSLCEYYRMSFTFMWPCIMINPYNKTN